jgi:hypothetical protein
VGILGDIMIMSQAEKKKRHAYKKIT